MRVAAGYFEVPGGAGGDFTIAREVEGAGTFASAPLRQYARIRLQLAPRWQGFPVFEWQAPREELPFDYMRNACRVSVARFLAERLRDGGYLVGVRVVITGGSYDEKCTDGGAVQRATASALRDALWRAEAQRALKPR